MDAAFFPSVFRREALPFGPGVRPEAERQAVSDRRVAGRRPSGAPAGGAALSIEGVGKRFGDKTVLAGIDLKAAPGEFVAIVGRSGCGKSTLLRLALGLERPEEGTIAIDGKAPGAGGEADARFVFQEPRLLPWERVVDNVALGAPRHLKPAERRDLAEATLARVGLEGRGAERPAVLSGGQRQRVALARAIVSRPRLLALDEPLGALDALTRIEMQRLLETVWQAERFTVLLVTHDVAEAVALADRVVLMEDGRIAYEEAIDLPRPRRHGDAEAGRIERRILDRLLA
ncbi:aliphatic sulfonates import ATP-binding protein SsuB [Aureimonas endophytica]|uniref:Aliphatic sulfonates import ATP-binding protein SsuB n=1 Tax=Aureimonas endophytica TaxID=2027858 RepID=A0A916ZHH2_9HYPH|nr:ABC transporter ATP-binding protein [Aureimonas endophytica]GGD98234.1 aliphatic sulfonates import ATP-binding protein SsuB [Aureimonas endophytica]